MTVDAVSGVVAVTAGLAVGRATAVFSVRDERGDAVRFTLRLRVDDVDAEGYGDVAMFVVGGDDGARQNDVWRSTDGVAWTAVAAVGSRFSGRRYHQAVFYDGSLWVVGGDDGGGEE